jgi:pyrimidine-specific ribonucleoside hydrolase
MGGLNTINSYLDDYPEKIEQVKEILWTCNYDNLLGSFNYLLDTISFNSLKNKKFEINYIDGASFGKYNNDLVSEINNHDTQLAKSLYKSLSISNNPFAKKMYDESAVFYLLNKQIISFDSTSKVVEYSLKPGLNINNHFIDLLSYNSENKNQVLSEFSVDTSDYISDIQLMMKSTIKKYGKEEWAACVLTSELHRHLGVYSLIGAKMGMRAREFFGAGVDELRIVSYAGLKPPFSCLNDGLQVSTGATLGHGLISVNENTKLPKAEFYYLGQKITISLKEEYRNKIVSEIKDLSIIYGLDSNIYWDLVRNLALQYWENWDRHDIFEIEVK